MQFFRNQNGTLREIRLKKNRETEKYSVLAAYNYDRNGDLIKVEDPAGTRTYTYSNHLHTQYQDRCGGISKILYDQQRRCIQTIGPGNTAGRTYEYDSLKNRTVVRDSLGNRSIYKFSDVQTIISTTDPIGGESTFLYDGNNRLVLAVDQMGKVTVIDCKAKIRPDGSATAIELDDLGQVSKITNTNGVEHQFKRDELGRVVEMKRPPMGTTRIGYADDGSIQKIKIPFGREITLTWNEDRSKLSEADEEGLISEQEFDIMGRLVVHKNALGATTQYHYDGSGHLNAIQHPDNSNTDFKFDPEGRLLQLRDASGNMTQWHYNDAGQCEKVTLPTGSTIESRFDAEKRMSALKGPDMLWHNYEYDPRGLVIKQRFSDGRLETYDYDARGLPTKIIAPDGEAVAAVRDEIGRIRELHYSEGPIKSIEYDSEGNWLRIECNGHLLKREFNSEGLVVIEHQDMFGLYREFGEAGELLSVVDTLGQKIQYEYDDTGKVEKIEVISGTLKEDQWEAGEHSHVHEFVYDRTGNLVVWKMPNGKTETRTYDTNGRLTGQIIQLGTRLILNRNYSYNAAGRLIGINDSNKGKKTFSYDSLGRLLSLTQNDNPTQTFQYNSAGDLVLEGFEYDSGHRIRKTEYSTVKYDQNGYMRQRLSPEGIDYYDYNANGLLHEVRLGKGGRIQFEYDPKKRLIETKTTKKHTRYYWAERQIWALQEDKEKPKEYLYLPGVLTPLEQCQGDRVLTMHTDPYGNILEMIDDVGNIVWQRKDTVWGVRPQSPGARAAGDECHFGFVGQIWEPESGIYYNTNRFYNPETAHFLTPDPIGIWGGLDNYTYPLDPVNLIDPLGLKCRGKNDDDILYRGDTRPPDEVCKNGFAPRNPNAGLSVAQHVEGVPSTGSNWISTTHDMKTAEGWGDNVFVFHNPGCGVEVDCDPDLIKKYGSDSPDSEHEIAFNKTIPPGKIVGFFSNKGGIATFQACP